MLTSDLKINSQNCSGNTRDPELEGIEITAESLARDIIEYKIRQCPRSPSSIAKIMRRTVDEMLEKHSILLTNVGSRLNIQRDTYQSLFVKVLDEMFNDHNINWGRIIAIYAFVSQVAIYFNDHKMSDLIDLLPHLVRNYMSRDLSRWILTNQGWENFKKHFSNSEDTENSFFKGLLFTGIGLTFLAGIVAVR